MSLALLLGTAGYLPAMKVSAASGVTINEVCPKNTSYAAPDGGMYDWVELYNNSGSSVDISGWGFTDKADTPYRFTFPSGTVIPAGGRKVFFCDSTAGETNKEIVPFGLSTSGETLTLTDASGNVASQITFEALAKDAAYGQYPDGSGSNAVRTPSFSAESGFYNNGFALTIDVPHGTTVYYTTDGSDPTTESERYSGAITVRDMTSEPNKYSARTDVTAYTDILAPDEGVLKAAVVRAVAVDSQGRKSPIITKTYFIGSANVERYRNMKVISLVTDPDNLFDYDKGIYVKGRVYDQGGGGFNFPGMGNWGQPGQNGQQPWDQQGQNPQNGQQQGWNMGDWGQQGQQPGQNGQQQGWNMGDWGQQGQNPQNGQQQGWNMGDWGNMNLGGAGGAVVMADEGGQNGGWNMGGGGWNPGGQQDGGFGGQPGGWNPGGQPGGGFGFDMGDMAFMSQANYNQKGAEWERPANIEVFENGKSVLSQDVGIRTKGAASRAWPQKSFNIFARADYGKSDVEYDLFEGKSTKAKNNKVIDKFDGFTIRNGGNDNMAGYFRDSVNQSLVGDRDMATQATSECILFIDGEFWGIYQLMEKYNSDYFKSHYGIKKNDVAFIKNGSLEEGSDQDMNDWNNLLNEISRADMNSDAAYQQICQKLDIQSFIDYFAAQIYWANHDWPNNNTAAWRSNAVDESNPYADGKWRMVLFDTEYSSNLADKVSETGPTYNSFSQFGGGGGGWGGFMGGGGGLSGAFSNLMKNAQFKKQFELSFMDMANYNFDTSKTSAAINYYKKFKQQILDTYKRFPSSKHTHNEQTFEQDYQLLDTFYKTRYSNVTSQMKNYMGLTGNLANVTVNNDGSKGSIKFNTINLDDSLSTWSGKYFTDYPVTVKAMAKEGYEFNHWEVSGANVSNTSSDEITVPVSEGVSIKAVYKTGSIQQPTDPPVSYDVVYGDANCDGNVDLSDVVLIMQSLASPNKYGLSGSEPTHITKQGLDNADCTGSKGVTTSDAQSIQRYLLGIIPSLPEK